VLIRFLLLALLLALPTTASAAEPWDTPFNDDVAATLAALDGLDVSDRAGGWPLLVEARYSLDEDSLQVRTTRVVTLILDRDGVEEYGNVGASWAPWYEDEAVVRARVLKPDGSATELDPSTLMQRRVGGEADMYWDRQVLEGPLPGIEVGSVVETEVTVGQHRPFFDAGTVTRTFLVGSTDALTRRLILDHPKSLKVKVSDEGAGAPVKRTVQGRLIRTWEISGGTGAEDYDPWLPGDTAQFAEVGFATGASWKAIATAYADQVNSKLAGEDLLALATEAAGDDAGDRDRAAQRLLAWVQDQVRYTGLELGENALIPAVPTETLERGYGDCKDQSTLLVGMMRALGYEAHVALLSATGRRDVDADLPGLGDFDHAIVVVRGPGEPLWIDPTDRFERAGRVAVTLEDRLALIADDASKGLVRIVASGASDSGWEEVRTLRIEDEGLSSLNERTRYWGWNESESRQGYTGTTETARRDYLAEYVAGRYETGELTELSVTDPDDREVPFVLDLSATGVGIAWSEDDEAWARLPMSSLFGPIDDFFWQAPDEPRTDDVYYYGPYTGALEYVVHPPAGYVATEMPESEELAGGPFSYRRLVTAREDGAVVVRFETAMAGRRFGPEELTAMRAVLGELSRPDPPYLRFVHASKQLADLGRVPEAITEARGGREGGGAIADVRLAELLLTAGAGEAARQVAERATLADPELSRAWRLLGWTRQHDELGRRLAPGWDREGSIAAYEKALELSEDDWIARADLSVVLEHDLLGQRYGRGADVEASIEQLQTLREAWDVPTFEDNLLVNLFRVGDFAELRKLEGEIGTGGSGSLIVAAAAMDGPEAALMVARRETTTEQDRTQLLAAAYSDLYSTGRFGAAADLLDQIAPDEGGADGREVRRVLRRAATLEIPETPRSAGDATLRWLLTAMDPDLTPEVYAGLLAAPAAARMTPERLLQWQHDLAAEMAPTLDEHAMSPDAAMQMVLAGIDVREEEIDKRTVAVRLTVGIGEGKGAETIVMLKEKGKWGLLGAGELWDPLGDHAASLLDTKPDVARRLIQVAGAELVGDTGFGGLALRRALKQPGPEGTALGAAVLSCFRPTPTCLDEMEAFMDQVTSDADRRVMRLFVAGGRLELNDWGGAARQYEELWAGDADKGRLGTNLFRALLAQGETEAAEAVATETAAGAADPAAVALDFTLARQEFAGDLIGALETMRALEEHDPERDYANNRAWYSLIVGQAGPEATAAAEAAARSTGRSSTWHTLATAYAEEGRAAEAHDALLRSMAAEGRKRPTSDDWYVIGRIAQLYGEPDAAILAYERVKAPTRPNKYDSTWELAARRLTELRPSP